MGLYEGSKGGGNVAKSGKVGAMPADKGQNDVEVDEAPHLQEHHEHMASHHDAKAAFHENLAATHERMADHHCGEAEYHRGKAG